MATGTSSCFLSIDDFNKVSLSCRKVSPQFSTLAKHLNVGVTTVENIEVTKGGRDTVWCLDELLKVWLRQTSESQPKPSWRVLCDAIANIDRPLSENIWAKLTSIRTTPVATAVQRNDPTLSAKELSSLFDELLDFTTTEIQNVNVRKLRLKISQYFKCEDELNDETDRHLMRIEAKDCPTPEAILNYFVRHNFIGYINYSLIKVFQEIAKSPLLDKRIEQYERDYQCFLELSLSQIHDAFQQCPDLCPNYPAGIPKFTIHLQSEWDGKSIFHLKEFLKKCFTNNDCVDHLMITDISRKCIIITYAVLPHIARKVIEYLTNDDVIMSMKKEGISIEISKQLMKYREEPETTSMEQKSGTLEGLETNLTSYNSQDSQLQKRIKSLESQLVNRKQMMMELDNTRDELKRTKRSREEELQVSVKKRKEDEMKLDHSIDELKKTEQSLSVVQDELASIKKREEDQTTLLGQYLCDAAKKGDTDRIQILIKLGAKVNTTSSSKDSNKQTPLHLASSNGHSEAVNLLISLGAKVNAKDVMDRTPLHDASSQGHSDVVNILVSHGATVNEKDKWDRNPLHDALSNGHSDVVNILLSHGATINQKSDWGRTPLHDASSHGHSDVINMLISHGATVNEKDNRGRTPLHDASSGGHSDVVNILVSHEATVNEKSDRGHTPLHDASLHGHNDVVNIILLHGATVNEKDNECRTPLHDASYNGHSDVINILLSHGATVNEKDDWGNTPLHGASKYTHSDTVNVLLSHGAIVNSVSKTLQTPLHRCLIWSINHDNMKATAELLISHGADLYHEDEYGNSPVLIATVLGYEDLMLSHGVGEDIISKYRLPSGWEAKGDYDSRIKYTNTVTGVVQYTHPSVSDSTHYPIVCSD